MTPDQQKHLLELFVAFSHETLTEAELQELQAVLRADVEARSLWFLNQDLELGLKYLNRVDARVADQTRTGSSFMKGSVDTVVGPVIRAPASVVDSWLIPRHLMVATVALLCLSAMVLFGVQILIRQPGSDHTVRNKITNKRTGNFIVESPTHGTKFTLGDHQGKLLALHFLLKTECPNCLKLAHDYSQLATSNPNVVHLFLKPDSIEEIKLWAGKINQEGLKNPPVIYRDPQARLAKDFGIPDGYKFHDQTIHYPALVLLDSSGQELFRYVGKNNTDRMKPDDFLARLAMVTNHN
jgi:thioredoxin-dependent peroxiredoxin